VLRAERMPPTTAEVDRLTDRIIRCAIEVHRAFGPGLLESVYRDCLIIELRSQNLRVESERRVQCRSRQASGGSITLVGT
jgi:GxxExxY protein